MKILIFGGTGEARELAELLGDLAHEITISFAGRTPAPKLPDRTLVRTGGFGGTEELCAYIKQENFTFLLDATHPYTQKMSARIVTAATLTGVPMLRLTRQPWQQPKNAIWVNATSVGDALKKPENGANILVTSGHKGLEHLAKRPDCKFLVRLIVPPKIPLPENTSILLAQPLFSLAGETELMEENKITHLIAKNSGGKKMHTKIDAAASLGLTTIIIDRPVLSPTSEVTNIQSTIAHIQDLSS